MIPHGVVSTNVSTVSQYTCKYKSKWSKEVHI